MNQNGPFWWDGESEGGGGRFLLKFPGGGSPVAGRVSAVNWGLGGGGAKYFFSGPKCPPSFAREIIIFALGDYRSSFRGLVAPYCALPRDYLSDTPLLSDMGFLVSQHGQLGAIPPPPFLSVSPLESMRSGGAIPLPHKRSISRILARYHRKTRQMGAIPPSAILSRKGIARSGGGGVSLTGPLSSGVFESIFGDSYSFVFL